MTYMTGRDVVVKRTMRLDFSRASRGGDPMSGSQDKLAISLNMYIFFTHEPEAYNNGITYKSLNLQ